MSVRLWYMFNDDLDGGVPCDTAEPTSKASDLLLLFVVFYR